MKARAMRPSPEDSGLCLLPGDLRWQDNPVVHGLETAVLMGDPNAAGSYVQRIKMPAGTRLAPHWHADEVRMVTVLEGTLYFAFGDEFDEARLKALPAGSFFVELPGLPHFAMTKGEVILQLDAVGPTGTTYVKAAEGGTPRKGVASRPPAPTPSTPYQGVPPNAVSGLELAFA